VHGVAFQPFLKGGGEKESTKQRRYKTKKVQKNEGCLSLPFWQK
jgi:hypothetical protein